MSALPPRTPMFVSVRKAMSRHVDALRTRQKLKNKDFTEQRGIFGNDACGCLTGHAYADGGTDAAEKCCQNCADKRENNAERVDIELIHVIFPP